MVNYSLASRHMCLISAEYLHAGPLIDATVATCLLAYRILACHQTPSVKTSDCQRTALLARTLKPKPSVPRVCGLRVVNGTILSECLESDFGLSLNIHFGSVILRPE